MAFAIAVANLKETMKEPGCPICSLERKAARKTADGFLYEHMMDPEAREEALSAYGFCPPHTRLMAATELASTGEPQGINMLYETLNRRVSAELKAWQGQAAVTSGLRGLLERLGLSSTAGMRALRPAHGCPVCAAANLAGLNALTTLMDELQRATPDITQAYLSSDGLCIRHVRLALEKLSGSHPKATRWLIAQTTARLDRQAAAMQEFVRKKNWEYHEEKLTAEEALAWRQSLTFFTGYPGDSFTFNAEDL